MSPSALPIRYQTHLVSLLENHSSRAPGINVVEPPVDDPRAERGNLYVLVELMGESPVRGQALRQIQATIQEIYYTAGGSVSAILTQAIQEAHEMLYDLNRRSPSTDLRAGVLCATLVRGHLIMASAGPALALLSTETRLDQFPPGPNHYVTPLGGDAAPSISFHRHQVRGGDVLFIGESDWILLTNVKTLGGAVATANRENLLDVADYLRRQSNHAEILGLLVVVEAVEAGTGPANRSTAAPRRAPSGLPTAVGTQPPVRGVPTAPPPAQRHRPSTGTSAAGTRKRGGSTSQARAIQPQQVEVLPPDRTSGSTRASGAAQAQRILAALSGLARNSREQLARSSEQIAQLVTNVLPDRKRTATAPPEWVGTLPDLDGTDAEGETTSAPDARATYTPPERTRGGRARLFILLALLLPLIVFATVGAVYLQRGAASQAEGLKLVDLAEAELLKAEQALGVGDESTARATLGEAQRYLDEAIALIGITDRIRDLSGRIQVELQGLLQVHTLYSLDFPLVQFPPDANPHRVAVFNQDVYVLDTGRQVVEAFRTDPSRTLVQERNGVILREGDVVEGITVGRLVDIAWQPRIPGFADKASLLILDRNNNIFRYNQIDEATHLSLANAEQLQSISQIETYSGRLYLVDEQANQIWRYNPAGLGYDQAPEPWFNPQVQVNLAGIVATAIDGDIWMLAEDGTILRYRQGQQLPFSLENVAGLTGRKVDMVLAAESDGRIYLADSSQNRILVFDKEGNYVEQFQAAENNALQGLRGLYLDNVTGTLFILTQSSLYAHSLPR